jgi:hypothetical protein
LGAKVLKVRLVIISAPSIYAKTAEFVSDSQIETIESRKAQAKRAACASGMLMCFQTKYAGLALRYSVAARVRHPNI